MLRILIKQKTTRILNYNDSISITDCKVALKNTLEWTKHTNTIVPYPKLNSKFLVPINYLDHADAKSKIKMLNIYVCGEEAKDFKKENENHVNQILTTKQERKRNSQLKHVNFNQPSL